MSSVFPNRCNWVSLGSYGKLEVTERISPSIEACNDAERRWHIRELNSKRSASGVHALYPGDELLDLLSAETPNRVH